jgi:glycosyltransferase involved in cell wall biosynthesis
MHILTLTTLFPNALQPVHGIFIRNRMERFAAKYGHRWTVAAPVPWFPRLPFRVSPLYDKLARVPETEAWNGTAVHHPRYLVTPRYGMRYYGAWMASGARALVKSIHARDPIDVIDGHYIFPDGTAACDIARELGIPVILSGRGTDLNLYPAFKAIRPLIRKNLEQASHVICVSSSLGKHAMDAGLPEEKLSVIGNGIDPGLFQPRPKAGARGELGLAQGKVILFSVGHLTERKGFHILIEAFARLERDDSVLVIVGDGPERKRLEALAERLGLGSRLHLAGAKQQEELPPYYAAADLFVLMSSREGWPNVVCEARAMGLPVVATRVDGIEDIVQPPDQGILLDERSVAALEPALRKALETRWDIPAIARSGAQRTWDAVADQLEPIFRAAVAGFRK